MFGSTLLDGVRKFVQAKRQKSHCLLLFCGISQICALVSSFRGEKTDSTTTGSNIIFSGHFFFNEAPKLDVLGDSGCEGEDCDKTGPSSNFSVIIVLTKTSLTGGLGSPDWRKDGICTGSGPKIAFSATFF